MYSLKEWYHLEYNRLQKYLEYNRLQKYLVDLSKQLQICIDRVSQPFFSPHDIKVDLSRAFFHPSLSYNHYCRQWLNYQGKSYLQGMHDGQLAFIATQQFFNFLLHNEVNTKSPYQIVSFAYQNEQGSLSTFLLYVEPNKNYWTVAVCHNPLLAPADLRFDIICSIEGYTNEQLIKMIAQEEISKELIKFIKAELDNSQNLDPQEIKIKARTAFSLQQGSKEKEPQKAARTYSSLEINQKLWGEHAYKPSELNDKTIDARIDEINIDFQRTLVHPSLPIDTRPEVLKSWRTSSISYYQGMIAGSYATKKLDTNEKIYDIKFNFIYQTDTGHYASYYFYMDILNEKCFLSCCDDPIQPYHKQAFECLFPLAKMPSQTEVQEVVKNSKLSDVTMSLLTKLPRLSALQHTHPDELKGKIRLLQECFRYEFGLEYNVNETQYSSVPEPQQASDDILPKLNISYYFNVSCIYLTNLLIAFYQAIINFLSKICSCFSHQGAYVVPESTAP